MKMALTNDVPAYFTKVLEFSAWPDRFALMQLNRSYFRFMSSDQFFNFCVKRLILEDGVYAPLQPLPGSSWKSMLQELYPLRNMWSFEVDHSLYPTATPATASANAITTDRFKINVYARFRPKQADPAKSGVSPKKTKAIADAPDNTQDENDTETEVNLPLHQRLEMIKMSYGTRNNREALKILASEGGWFEKKWKQVATLKHQADEEAGFVDENKDLRNVPKFRQGAQEKIVAAVQNLDPGTGRVVMLAPDVGLREFTFDGLIAPQATQASLYNSVVKRLVMDFINGYNATSVVYGQTGW